MLFAYKSCVFIGINAQEKEHHRTFLLFLFPAMESFLALPSGIPEAKLYGKVICAVACI